MINKEMVIGVVGGVLAIAGLYFAIKSSSNSNSTSGSATTGYSTLSPYASYTPVSGGTVDTSTTSGTTVATAQTGDLSSVLQSQADTQNLTATANAQIGILNAINSQSATVLARGADLASRQAGTLDLNYNQQVTANNAPSLANGQTTTSPISAQVTAHLTETVPGMSYAPVPAPAPIIVPPAPVVVQSQPSSGGGGCFITTAVCDELGLPDDCDELQTLRHFRDTYMSETRERKLMIAEYYAQAPIISRLLSSEQLRMFKITFINTAVYYIKQGDNDVALKIYSIMFDYAKVLAVRNAVVV